MNVKTVLEALRQAPRDEAQLRWVALELGGALAEMKDEELAQLGSGLARVQTTDPDASAFVLGFRSALSALLSGARQQRQQAREQRAMERELNQEEISVRQAWRRLLPAMRQETFQQKKLAEVLGMHPAQVSRNVKAMMEAGLLEEVPVEESGAVAAAHDKRVHHYRLTSRGRQLAELLAAKEPEPAIDETPDWVQEQLNKVAANALWPWGTTLPPMGVEHLKMPLPETLRMRHEALRMHDEVSHRLRVVKEALHTEQHRILFHSSLAANHEHDLHGFGVKPGQSFHALPESGENYVFLTTPGGHKPLQVDIEEHTLSELPSLSVKHRSVPVTRVASALRRDKEGEE